MKQYVENLIILTINIIIMYELKKLLHLIFGNGLSGLFFVIDYSCKLYWSYYTFLYQYLFL